MPSALLLAVNRHQERYFAAVASSTDKIDIDVLHDNRLPLAVLPRRLSQAERRFLSSIVALRVTTVEQESKGYRLNPAKRVALQLRYWLEVYSFWLRAERFFGQRRYHLVGLWSGMKWRQKMVRKLLETTATRLIFFENGAFPNTTTVDERGVNYASSIPRDAHFYRQLNIAAEQLPAQLTERKPRKGALAKEEQQELPPRYVFVPFQVDSDTQIVEYSPWINNMEQLHQLLSRVLQQCEQPLVFVVKEHPSSKNDYRHLHQAHDSIRFYNQANTQVLIEQADAVLTINSSVGFEALLLNKPVITLGQAFYNIDGLVTAVTNATELTQACRRPNAPDPVLRERFLQYLYRDYYVHGDWRQADERHHAMVEEKITAALPAS
ncbi:capsular biosynthesis protein [Bacterioplanes sanyensis]|uniref:Capsular biosynthesis protein n=1 Tax=Bacterioplanes sanyensis TaxID=1249553 RepID=A0A222FID9_9GAMM|nr:CDP-glycerol glycerophosphotransferase family protein [Bacterioplanes sanyensis]ASP38181.1 capsular biosynthesis protein [Bacterioplanes sanyensis]